MPFWNALRLTKIECCDKSEKNAVEMLLIPFLQKQIKLICEIKF